MTRNPDGSVTFTAQEHAELVNQLMRGQMLIGWALQQQIQPPPRSARQRKGLLWAAFDAVFGTGR